MRRRSLLLTGPQQLQWLEEALPPVGVGEVLVQTIAGAVSLGTELPQYLGTARSAQPARYPKMTGYESVGVVVARGRGVHHVEVGERVVGFYGHRTAAVVPQAKVIPVPAPISDQLALLVILSCDVAKGIRKVGPRPDEPVLVTGAGTIGLLTVWTLTTLGVRTVDVLEPNAARCSLARELGATRAVAPEDHPPTGDGYAVGFECSSANDAFTLLQASMRPGGRICLLSDGNREPLVLSPAFHDKELTVVGSSDGWDYHQHAQWYFDAVRGDSRPLEAIFDYHTTADNLAGTVARLASGGYLAIKVFVRYG